MGALFIHGGLYSLPQANGEPAMLSWLIALWLASPALVPILWLLSRLHQSLAGTPEAASPAAHQRSLPPGD